MPLLTLMIAAISCANTPLRIVCIGDSISQGRKGNPADAKFPPTYSYRYRLWQRLIDAGVNVTMVGEHEGGFEGSPVYEDYKGQAFANRHEAYWGWTTAAVAEQVEKHAKADKADVAIIMLGSNDQADKKGFEPTLTAMSSIVASLRAANPKVKVLLGLPTEEWAPFPKMCVEYTNLSSKIGTKASPVIPVELAKDWISKPDLPGTCTVDWVHPNKVGDDHLSKRFCEEILRLYPNH